MGAMKTAIVFSALLSLCCSLPAFAESKGLDVLTEEWGPITFEENGKARGFAVDVVEAIQAQIKDNTVIQVVPWTRAFHEAQRQPNVVLFTVIRNKDREKLFTLLGPLGSCEVSFYGLEKSHLRVNSLEDAKKLTAIAANQDSLFASTLASAGFENIVLTKNPEQEARLLAAGRVDLISNDPLVVEASFKKIGRGDLKLKKYFTVEKGEFYIAFSKGTPYPMIEQWKKALTDLKQSGTFANLVHKWLPDSSVLPDVQLVKQSPNP